MTALVPSLFFLALVVLGPPTTTAGEAPAPPLTQAQLAQLRLVPAWDIDFTYTSRFELSGTASTGMLGNHPVGIGPVTSVVFERVDDMRYASSFTVAGNVTQSDCSSRGSNACGPKFTEYPASFTLLSDFQIRHETIQFEFGCPQGQFTSAPYSIPATTLTAGQLAPPAGYNSYFFIDYGVNPPSTELEVRTAGLTGQQDIITDGCLRDDDPGTFPFYRISYFSGFGLGDGTDGYSGDTYVRVENLGGGRSRFVVRGSSDFVSAGTGCDSLSIRCDSHPPYQRSSVDHAEWVATSHDPTIPEIHSVEFTQAIQVAQPLPLLKADLVGDGSPPVPIVAGKPTVMRVNFDEVQAPTDFTLEVSGGPITESRTGFLNPGCTPDDQRRRNNACFARDFFFTPPEGPWSLTLVLKDQNGIELESHVLNLISKKSDALVLKAISVCDAVDATGNWQCASGATLQTLVGLLKKIAPTDNVVVIPFAHQVKGQVIAAANADGDSDDYFDDNGNGVEDLGDRCEPDVWWVLIAKEIHNLFSRFEPPGGVPGQQVYYYGLTRPGIPGGTLGIANDIPSRGAASTASAPFSGAETAPWVVSHETGHMLGRRHTNTAQPALGASPPGCWLGPSSQPTWIYADNLLRSGPAPGVLEVGFDVVAQTVLAPQTTFDVMGYCAGTNWISPHSTQGILQVLDSPLTAAPVPAAAAGQLGSYWQVSGPLQGGDANLDPIFIVQTQGSTEPGSGTHRIDVLGAQENVLFTRFFTPMAPHISPGPDEPAPDGTPFFSELIPVQASATSIAVKDPGGITLAQVALGGTSPTVNITFPAGAELFRGPETATWTVTDLDSTSHMFHVHYSPDGGVTWRSLTSAESALSLVVDFSELPGSVGQSLLRVFASDGVNTGSAVSNPFSVVKKQPTAEIVFPATGASFAVRTLVLLQAVAFDPDDGLLTDSSLQWSSDVDGPLGNGDDLPVYSLSPERHTITLAATDGDGNTATDQVSISLFDPPTADGDGDDDVDLVDFKRFADCWNGPGASPPAPSCLAFDFDVDGDLDAVDFAAFHNCVSGSDVHATPNCAR